MRPTLFRSDVLRRHLLQAKMATLGELKRALGTQVDLTVFRKLKQLDYLTSYSHRARYYTLRQIARFDADGLWSYDAVWFSGHGTLLATAEAWVQHSARLFRRRTGRMPACRNAGRALSARRAAPDRSPTGLRFVSYIAPAIRSSVADNSWHAAASSRSPPWWMPPDW